MARRLSLRTRIYVPLGALVLVALVGALVTVWYTVRLQTMVTELLERDVAALTAAEELAGALVAQKGFATYYFLTGDAVWLKRLDERSGEFEAQLETTRQNPTMPQGRALLNEIEAEYVRYDAERGQVLEMYASGKRQAGANLHWDVRDRFNRIYTLCQEYKELHKRNIADIQERSRSRARTLAAVAWAAVPGAALMGLGLFWVLYRQVLEPLRRLAAGVAQAEGGRLAEAHPSRDEVSDLTDRVRGLITDVDTVHMQLRESREVLAQSEKLAVVGKLAAGVAHSIRNPLTSVKMRLYTLQRTLHLDDAQKEDFEVISEEVGQIDGIVRSFLEFARPPKLVVRPVSFSDVVDSTLALLRHKLESYHVDVLVEREGRLPEVMADPEQVKEVLVNLVLNACEAMGVGGTITIAEEEGHIAPQGRVALLRVSDTGPGVPETVRGRIFEPFFTTKEEGSGLGLAIAARIMTEHGGWLHLASGQGRGATFVVGMPAKESGKWLRS
jgi:signal transduction histidine kinase